MSSACRTTASLSLAAAACCVAAVCLCAGSAVAQAAGPPARDEQVEQISPRIVKITVLNNRLLTAEQVLETLGVREGEPFSDAGFQTAVTRWNKGGLYGTMSFRVEPAAAGQVELILTVSERVKLTSVGFRGNELFSSGELAETVGMKAGDSVSEGEVRDAEQRIAAAYQKAGFPLAAVHGRLVTAGAALRDLAFDITEGPEAHVEEIVFEGNEHVPSSELLDTMETRTRSWLPFLRAGLFNEDTFRQDVRRVEAALRDRGYLDAQVKGERSFSADMTRVTVRLAIVEGPLYTVKAVIFEGNTLFRDSELLAALPITVGGPYRPDAVAQAVEAISALYADQGYWDVTAQKGGLVVQEAIPPEGTEVTLTFRIAEGQPVEIRRIEIRGLTKTNEDVVRRNLTFYPGETASAADFRESEQALVRSGYFDARAARPVQIGLEPSPGALRDAIVQVQEGPTGRFLLSAGVGSDAGLLGGVSLEEDNFDIWKWPHSWSDLLHGNAFRGGGQRLSLVLQAGTRRSFYSILFENPAVYNTDYGLALALYSRGLARSEFDETRTGFSVSISRKLTKFTRRTVTAGYEAVSVENVAVDAPAEIIAQEGSHAKPFVRVGASVDRRDTTVFPTEGYAMSGEVELAAGDTSTVKVSAQGEKYWTVHEHRGRDRHVVGLRGRAAVVTSYAGDVPVYERLYAGGASILRGFAFEGAAPADPVTNKLVGGKSLLVGSVEYSLPLSEEDRLRLVTFCDAGWVTDSPLGLIGGLGDLRLSLGLGLRWQWVNAYFAPLAVEVSLAAPVITQSADQTQILQFSLGAERRF